MAIPCDPSVYVSAASKLDCLARRRRRTAHGGHPIVGNDGSGLENSAWRRAEDADGFIGVGLSPNQSPKSTRPRSERRPIPQCSTHLIRRHSLWACGRRFPSRQLRLPPRRPSNRQLLSRTPHQNVVDKSCSSARRCRPPLSVRAKRPRRRPRSRLHPLPQYLQLLHPEVHRTTGTLRRRQLLRTPTCPRMPPPTSIRRVNPIACSRTSSARSSVMRPLIRSARCTRHARRPSRHPTHPTLRISARTSTTPASRSPTSTQQRPALWRTIRR